MADKNSVRYLKKKAQKLFKKNKLIEARDIYIPLCKSVPNDIDSWVNLATIFRTLNDLENAEQCCKNALAVNSKHTLATHTYASVLHIKGNRPAAINIYLMVLNANDTPNETYYFIANAYRETGDLNNAQLYYEKLLKLEPSHFEGLNNLSALYTKKGMISQSLELLEHADKIQPGHQFVKNNLAKAYLTSGDTKKSSLITRSILDTGIYEPYIASNYLLSLNYLQHEAEFIFNEHKHWAAEITKKVISNNSHYQSPSNSKIKIGFLSADLNDHPVARFIISFFKHYNKDKFSIYCYADAVVVDNVSTELKSLVDSWSTVAQLNNNELAKNINRDGINILIDLAGHTGSNRMPMYALKPAPVQVTYLGYPNTTGMAEMDYRICDNITDPSGLADQYHTEKLCRLPNSFLAYTPEFINIKPNHSALLNTENIMFGSFNNLAKTTPEVIAVWSKILQAVPGSKLTLKSTATSDSGIKARYLNLFKDNGIEQNRIVLLNTTTTKKEHYNRYNTIDIALDTFPYNGTTTTFEALWMGVPVITLSGNTHVSRVGCSILSQLALNKLIANDKNEYINAAVKLSADILYLKELHSTLRERLTQSSLFDYLGHTRFIETNLVKIWGKYLSQ